MLSQRLSFRQEAGASDAYCRHTPEPAENPQYHFSPLQEWVVESKLNSEVIHTYANAARLQGRGWL